MGARHESPEYLRRSDDPRFRCKTFPSLRVLLHTNCLSMAWCSADRWPDCRYEIAPEKSDTRRRAWPNLVSETAASAPQNKNPLQQIAATDTPYRQRPK